MNGPFSAPTIDMTDGKIRYCTVSSVLWKLENQQNCLGIKMMAIYKAGLKSSP